MTTWILLERTDDLLSALFRQMGHPDFMRLFDATELAIYRDFSPLLVSDNSDGTLLQAMHKAPDAWPGLMIESEQSGDAVREHLRHILIVRFDHTRRGMLRYWNPSVASHFFPASTAENLSLWLGPISRLSWHTCGESAWQRLDNPHAHAWQRTAANSCLVLSAEQSLALQQHLPTGQES